MTGAQKATFDALIASYRVAIRDLIARYPGQAGWEADYLGRIETARLVRFRRDVKSKLGVAFVKGELGLAFGEDVVCEGVRKTLVVRSCWSFRNDVSTSVETSKFEVVL